MRSAGGDAATQVHDELRVAGPQAVAAGCVGVLSATDQAQLVQLADWQAVRLVGFERLLVV